MTEIQEAPIVHGTISVSTFLTNFTTLSTASFSSIDTHLDINSTNPIQNGAIKTAIDNITTPSLSSFSTTLVIGSPTSTGELSFEYVSHLTNTFSTGGVSNNRTIIVPENGSYLIVYNTNASTQSNTLSMIIKINDTPARTSTGDGQVNTSTQLYLSKNDAITLHSANDTESQSTLSVTLIK